MKKRLFSWFNVYAVKHARAGSGLHGAFSFRALVNVRFAGDVRRARRFVEQRGCWGTSDIRRLGV